MTRMPILETARLIVRPLAMDDVAAIHHILDVELREAEFGNEGVQTLSDRTRWLEWTVLADEQLAQLNQPPYGERAIVLGQTEQLIGACGFVPCLAPFEQLPALSSGVPAPSSRFTTELGLFYAVAPTFQRRGYASEAARAMVDYAFQQLRLKRVVATTTYENAASMGVMRTLGMHLERNPFPEPPWFQVVGILENSTGRS